jgi:hypothetical protein
MMKGGFVMTCYGTKVTVTDFAAFIVTVHVFPDEESQPLQVTTEKSTGVAVRVTTEFRLKLAEQVAPQLIPAGLDVTVPPSTPDVETDNVTFTVNTPALVPVPPGVVTLRGPVVAPAGTVA